MMVDRSISEVMMKDNYSNIEWKLLLFTSNDYNIDCHDDHNDDNVLNTWF